MRKNTQQAYEAWKVGKARKPSPSIWTDGVSIYSYGTRIVTREDGRVVIDMSCYSRTTSTHQNNLRALLTSDNVGYKSDDNG